MPDGSAFVPPAHLPPGWDWKNPDYTPVWDRRLEAMRRLRARPELFAGMRELYANDWHAFINDWMVTVDPRNPERGLPAKTPFLLFGRQEDFVTWIYERWTNQQNGLCEKSRDSGATWLCCAVALCMWLYVPGSIIGFGSRKEEYVDEVGDPKSIFWKLRTALELLPVEFRPQGYDPKKHSKYMLLTNPENGNVILGEAGDNIGRGNRTTIYFVDEAAFIERPELVEAALSETTNCRIDVSTPNGMGNPFHRKRHSGKVPVFTFHWKDDPRKGEDWYARKVAQIDDPVIVAQEIDINYEASVDNLAIPAGLVSAAMNTPKNRVSTDGPRFLGVDVARFGSADSVITERKHRAVLSQEAKRGLDTQDVAGWVRDHIEARGGIKEYGAVCVDDIGVGGGVTDTLKRWYGKKIVGVNVSLRVEDGRNYNLRAKLVADATAWLKDVPNHLPNDPELRSQLGSIQKKYQGGLVLIESKDDMRRRGVKSPDRADSLFLTFASPEIKDEKFKPLIPAFEPLDRGMGY